MWRRLPWRKWGMTLWTCSDKESHGRCGARGLFGMVRQHATRNSSPYDNRDGMAKRPGCPCFLCGVFFVRDVLHEIAGLTVQGGANLVQDVNRNMLCSTSAQSGNCGLTDAGFFRKLCLRHIVHSKQNFQAEFNHGSTFFRRLLYHKSPPEAIR